MRSITRTVPRRAVSGMIVTIILIGIVVSIGGVLATTMTDIVTTGLVLDAVEIKRLNIQNTGTVSFITGMIKNSGNTDITNAEVSVIIDPAPASCGGVETFTAAFGSGATVGVLNSGQSKTVNSKIQCDDGAGNMVDARLTIGAKYQVEVSADIAGGGEYSTVKIISPQ